MTERTEGLLEDWREIPRSEMFGRVMLTVDVTARAAEDHSEWARFIDGVLIPFLEDELQKAKREEA